MPPEMILRYLYYLTKMNSGRAKEWKVCYEAWKKYGESIGYEKYEELMNLVIAFDKKYGRRK